MFNSPKTWHEAQSFCREKCLDLTTINNMTEMDAVLKAVEGKFDDTLWFGIWQGPRRQIHWSIPDRNLDDSSPSFSPSWDMASHGGCVYYGGEMFQTSSCDRILEFVCFDETKHGADQYILSGTMNWTDAQEYCRTTYTDLTSIRYQADFDIISAKIGDRLIWVGAFADSWKWSEGRDSSFRHWPPSKKFWELNEECGVLTKNNDRWGSLPCSEKRPFLCTCKDPASNLRVIKVRINLQDTSLDPNDPSVQDKILEQMMQKLNKSGVGDVKLQWKKQPDGKVFISAAP
nr:PREDICTED: uncharacterized protein LOC103370480 [Stegastes partitus]